jgi:hypothetical protein
LEANAFASALNSLVQDTDSVAYGYKHGVVGQQDSSFDRFSIPLVYHTLGEHDDICKRPFKQADHGKFGINSPMADDSQVCWLQVQVSVQGALMHELFIKNLTLCLN